MSENAEHVLYVDHSFHQQSKSTTFFPLALAERAAVTEVWDYAWKREPAIRYEDVAEANATRAVFFQSFPTPEFLRKFKKPIVVIPMFDDPASPEMVRLIAAYHVTVVCFTKAIEKFYRDLGVDVLPITYAPHAVPHRLPEGPLNLFFWDRGYVTWSDVKALIGEQEIGKIYLKSTPDPALTASVISDEDRERFDLEVITDWISKEAYNDLLRRCHIYVAPRFTEGIGMSFLEAMAHGLAVVAVNKPSMNEYIVHGQSGYLFDLPVKTPIDFKNAREIGVQAREEIARLGGAFGSQLTEVVDSILRIEYRPPNRALIAKNTVIMAINKVIWALIKVKHELGHVRRKILNRA